MGGFQPCTALAATTTDITEEVDTLDVEEVQDDSTVDNTVADTENIENMKYITAFDGLSDDESYLSCMYKPTLEELLAIFPTTLSVQFEGEETSSEIEVTWECEDDFDNSEFFFYIFYPTWDETKYALADSIKDSVELPVMMVELPSGMIANLEEAQNDLQNMIQEKSILALVYLCDKYEVKESASYESTSIVNVVCGQSVLITGVDLDEYGSVWYQVVLYQNGTEYTGYVERGYLATSDEDFAQWEETYINLDAVPMAMAMSFGYPDVEQFPASYQNALYALKEAHPNWIFVRMDTGLDWNTVIANEMGDKSLVHSSTSGSWQNGTYGQGWSYASEGILKYFMDPRNFLSDPAIFQFEQLTYNGSYHTTDAVQEIVKSSFMSSTIPDDNQTYAQAFTKIGQSLGISPFHLASRVLQEQGAKGTSPLISGTYSGYEGYYNYFNVSASGKTNQAVIVSGLKKAVEQGWNTRYKSLLGGATVIGKNYIVKGQDTLYLEKFNVSNGQYANFTHQYMQNIQAPSSEASSVRKAYNNAGALENSFVFKIPVYSNMPASACSKPNTTDAITLDKTSISNLEVEKTAKLTPYVNGSKVDNVNDMTFTSSNTAVATVDSQGKITAVTPGTVTISCSRSGANAASCTVTVIKATPSVTTPTLSPVTYKEGLKLSDITLPEGWTWVNGNTTISAGTVVYAALYTPSDTTKYNTVTKDISFTVTKAIPSCQVPENLTIQSGAKLGSIALPSGFAWESDIETELTEAGEYTFYVSYNPNENSYYTVNHIPIIVQVMGDGTDEEEDDTTSSGSTSGGITIPSSGSTGGSSNMGGGTNAGDSGSVGGGNTTTSSGSTSTGSTGNQSTTSSGSTSTGSTGNQSTTSSGSTSTGSTGNQSTTSSGSTNTGSTGNQSTTSSGSTSTGSTGNQSTTSSGSTSTGSTGNQSTTSSGSTSTGSTVNRPITSSGSTSTGSSGNQSVTSSGSTSTGSTVTSSGSTSVGSTVTSSGSTSTVTSSGSTSVGSTITSSGSTSTVTSSGTANTGNSATTTNNATTTNTEASNNANANSGNTTTTNAETSNSINANNGNTTTTNAEAFNSANANDGNTTVTNTETSNTASNNTENVANSSTTNVNDGSVTNSKPTSSEAVAVDSQTVLTTQDFDVEESVQETEEVTFVKPSVTIEMDDTTVLTVEKLQMAKEQNFALELNMGNKATWSIDVASADLNTLQSIDMGITFGANDIPMELIDGVADGNEYLQFTLAHDGPFGFDSVLNVEMDPENCGRYANLFYYNPETKALEFISVCIIDAEGNASFPMDHASSYVIIVSDQSLEGLLESDGENGMIKWIVLGAFIFMLLVVIGYGAFFFWKKKQDEEYDDDEEEENGEDDENEDDEVISEVEEVILEDKKVTSKSKVKSTQKEKAEKEKLEKEQEAEEDLEKVDMNASAEEDWIEDEDWEEPEKDEESESEPEFDHQFADDHAEDDWIDDDEWDIGNDWMDDAEWERKKNADKAKEQMKK